MAERNMCNVAMRDIVVLPGSKSHITRKRIASEPGRSRVWPLVSVPCTAVRIGKVRSRSR